MGHSLEAGLTVRVKPWSANSPVASDSTAVFRICGNIERGCLRPSVAFSPLKVAVSRLVHFV